MNRLVGKKTLVIGASTGIGREVCRLFASEGADVCVGDRGHDADKASLLAELAGHGGDAFAVEVDVLIEEQVQAAIEAAAARFGRLDVLVNNAGIGSSRTPLHEEPTEQFERMLDTNLRSAYFGMKHALPVMIAQGSGRIINTASQLAHKPNPGAASYSAAKAGMVALTAAVAKEVAELGITVNAVCPGPTDTPMLQRPGGEEFLRRQLEQVPMRRMAQPIEIAWAYVYLASDEASYCTGQSISPNGGDVMW
jgi:NAD(P)-dependent dehydrogenase (short-subunit alcohol dehydrogenase family)